MYAPLAFFMPGIPEMVIIGAIVLLLFGNRVPGAMRSLGRSVVEFKKGIQGVEDDVDNAGKPSEKQTIEN